MQPKKPILLYCPDRELLSSIAFVLRLHPYDVTSVHDGNAAIRVSERGLAACGVLIHAQQGDLAGRLIHRILECASHMPLLLVDRAGDLAPVRYADMVFAEIDPFCCWLLRSRYRASRPIYMPSPHDAPDRKEAKRRAAAIRNVVALPPNGDVINAGNLQGQLKVEPVAASQSKLEFQVDKNIRPGDEA